MELMREKAIDELRRFGITGGQVYLIDLIPLIEIIWADGKVQEGEREVLENYLASHVDHINALAGCQVLTLSAARAFIHRFLSKRPDDALLKYLRELVKPVRLSGSDEQANQMLKESLLSACLDIAAGSVTDYPYGPGERFNTDEKRCFFEILESLTGFPPGRCSTS